MGMITMVTSGKDGAGKSTVCMMLADALDALGKRTLIIELDTGHRSLDIMSGSYGQTVYDIFDAISGRCEPEQAIVRAPSPRREIYVMTAPYKNEPVSGEQFVRLCTALSEQYDHVIIDTSNHTGAIVAASTVAMNAMLLVTPDPLAIREGRILAERLGDLSVPNARLLITRVVPSRVREGIVANLDVCIDSVGLRLIGVVPEDDEIALACAKGVPLDTKSQCRLIFNNLAQRLCGNDVPLAMD